MNTMQNLTLVIENHIGHQHQTTIFF